MGILEYESVLVFVLIALDIIIGSINHIFKLKDNVSSIASESLANKCVQVVCILAMLPGVKSELNDMHDKLYTENKKKKEKENEEKES